MQKHRLSNRERHRGRPGRPWPRERPQPGKPGGYNREQASAYARLLLLTLKCLRRAAWQQRRQEGCR